MDYTFCNVLIFIIFSFSATVIFMATDPVYARTHAHIEAREVRFVRVCRLRSSHVFVCVYIGFQLFSAKMMVAGAPPGSRVWGGVGASTGVGYIGIQLFSAKMMPRGGAAGK